MTMRTAPPGLVWNGALGTFTRTSEAAAPIAVQAPAHAHGVMRPRARVERLALARAHGARQVRRQAAKDAAAAAPEGIAQ